MVAEVAEVVSLNSLPGNLRDFVLSINCAGGFRKLPLRSVPREQVDAALARVDPALFNRSPYGAWIDPLISVWHTMEAERQTVALQRAEREFGARTARLQAAAAASPVDQLAAARSREQAIEAAQAIARRAAQAERFRPPPAHHKSAPIARRPMPERPHRATGRRRGRPPKGKAPEPTGRPMSPWRAFRRAGVHRRLFTAAEWYLASMVWRLYGLRAPRGQERTAVPVFPGRLAKVKPQLGDARTVQRALSRLIDAGFLLAEPGRPTAVRRVSPAWILADDPKGCLQAAAARLGRTGDDPSTHDGRRGRRRKPAAPPPPAPPAGAPMSESMSERCPSDVRAMSELGSDTDTTHNLTQELTRQGIARAQNETKTPPK